MRSFLSASAVMSCLIVMGCDFRPTTGPAVAPGGGAGADSSSANSTGSGGTGGTAIAGLPCEVEAIVVKHCGSCHGAIPAGGAPRSLLTYADLTKPDLFNKSTTEAQAALERVQAKASPMPPPPASPATATEIATLQAWVNGGYPTGACGGDAGVPPLPDPLNAVPICTSKTSWNGGTEGSSLMAPGQACISCHAGTGGEAPRFVIAGTLYPTGHEPNDYNGVGRNSGATVVVTGKNGASITLTPNSAGNFFSTAALPPPYSAKVVNAAGIERVMSSPASTGDCNSCHTQTGASKAPGRITLP